MNEMETDHLSGLNLQVDAEAGRHITEAGKWGKFISIVIFVLCGIVLLGGLAGSAYIGSMSRNIFPAFGEYARMGAGVLIAMIVIGVAVAAFLYYQLFNFSQKAPMGVATEDAAMFNRGLGSLKLFFLISSIIAVLSLLLSLVNLVNIGNL